jgi:pimeloyl-ACP methyl ester carboxylesterase
MLREHDLIIEPRSKCPLYGTLRHESSALRAERLLVICHGFAATSRWGFIPALSEALVDATTATLALDFSRNGTRNCSGSIQDFQALRDNCYRIEEDDLAATVKAFHGTRPVESSAPHSCRVYDRFPEIFILGHSRGADSVLGFASRSSLVTGVITLNAKSTVRAITPIIAQRWRARGYWEEMDFKSGRRIPLGVEFLTELERGHDRIEQATRRLQCPLLAIHGERDQHTPSLHSTYLAQWASKGEVEIIQNADHFLGGEGNESCRENVGLVALAIKKFMNRVSTELRGS